MQTEVNENPRYAIVAAVQLPSVSDVEFEASLAELRDLAKTLGFKVVHTFTQKRAGFDATAYLGVGKREEGFVILLDIDRIFNSEDMEALRAAEPAAAGA